jgi:thiol-disulfide isomerase/thioredoxin
MKLPFLLFIVGFFSSISLADPPATLTLADLVNHPDRWPPAVSINQDIQFTNGAVVHQTDKLQVLKFDGQQLILSTSGNLRFAAKPENTNLLDAANQAWSALTPAQRAIDANSIAADQSLWPAKVTLSQTITYPQWGAMKAGTQTLVYSVTPQNITVDWPNSPNRINIDISATDLISQVRQLVLIDPDKRPSRIAAALDGILVDSDGKPYTDAQIQDKKYFAFYTGAGWCPPCQAFSPGLVKFASDALPKHPELAIVMLSNDKTESDMLAYMKQEQMPFPAVQLKDLNNSPLLITYSNEIIPDLVVTDRFGKIVATNVDPQGNRGDPADTIIALSSILNSSSAK